MFDLQNTKNSLSIFIQQDDSQAFTGLAENGQLIIAQGEDFATVRIKPCSIFYL
jgi:hypothetical protein